MTGVSSKMAGSSAASRAFYTFARGLVVAFCKVWFRLSVEGRENLPATGAFVVAPVHRSNLDTPFAAAVATRRVRFMGKDSLWKPKWSNWLLSALGGFPVTRGTADREALLRSIEVLKGGEPLVLFPEGERKSGPIVQPLFDGAAYVAAKCNVPIVPVGIGGSERAMPKGSKFLHPRKVHIVIGKPVYPEVSGGRVPRQAVRDLTDRVQNDLQRVFDTAQVRAGA
ncbi:MAG: lysophospholipid acyltransferase family protein [Acidimicrobiia bacterium]